MKRPAEMCSTDPTFQCNGGSDSSDENSKSIATEPSAKHGKVMHVERKTCGANGCEKSHLWSKKWVSCPKCHTSFCDQHKDQLQCHQCNHFSR